MVCYGRLQKQQALKRRNNKKQSSRNGSKRGYILNTFKGKVKEFEGNNYDCTDENNLKNVERLVTKAADYIVTQIKLVVS